MNLEFSGQMWFWKGPAPWHFITVAEEERGELEARSAFVTYGWGMIPVIAQIGGTGWKTSLFPKDAHGTAGLPRRPGRHRTGHPGSGSTDHDLQVIPVGAWTPQGGG